ncbi:MAG: polyphosphate kinase 1 [Flavobacteriales bacterium]
MDQETLLEKARLFVRRHFARHIPAHLLFHDLDHTLSVTRTALAIGGAMGLSGRSLVLLEIAALFHDTGYAEAHAGHEEHSATLGTSFLSRNGVPERDIAIVRAAILATRVGARPRSTLQRVLRDADSAKAGQVDFEEKGERLRRELEAVRGRPIDPGDWLRENLVYLTTHRFHTQYARERYGPQKAINLKTLRDQVRGLAQGRTWRKKLAGPFMERDLSWLSFNERVLQEAQDPRVPLLERLKFMAIYSSNLDEFYRVRVASLRGLRKLDRSYRTALDLPADKLVDRLNRKALQQQNAFGTLFRGTLIPALAEKGIRLLAPKQLSSEQVRFVRAYFAERVAALLHSAAVRPGNAPFIEDRRLYFACLLKQKGVAKQRMVLLNIPSEELGRFVVLPSAGGRTDILFLDDVVRVCLGEHFKGFKVVACHAIKLSRDAELYLDEEYASNVKEKVRRSLKKRRTGMPARFLYDAAMPPRLLRALRTLLGLTKQDMVPGGRYHNFSDFMKLPVDGHNALREKPWPSQRHPALAHARDPFRLLRKKDLLLHFPYHDFSQFIELLGSAARDKAVTHIHITLYRVADDSAVCGALLSALERGKKVSVFVEVQARFDERTNLYWGEVLERAGAKVIYSYERLKVHCKLCLIERTAPDGTQRFAYLGTGNFNERSARIYADSALLTADPTITGEVAEVFRHLEDRRHRPRTHHLLVAPMSLRSKIETLIDQEIAASLNGMPSGIFIKVNSLEDRALIEKLYDASRAGVPVRLIVRGICCLVTGVPGVSEGIEAISIVDRYLEHTRAYVFENGGEPLVYLSSADWMGRNLDRRVEVAFPLLDPELRAEMLRMLDLQWRDTMKARVLDRKQTNRYRTAPPGKRPLRAQQATWKLVASQSAG